MEKIKLTGVILLLLLCVPEAIAQRVLVISGGGARGAWGGGVIENLVEDQQYDYDAIVGTSTGSLMAPLVSLEDFTTLRSMYTGVKQRSIFNVNPFKVKKDAQGQVTSIKPKYLKAICRVVFGKKTLGESKNLQKLIHETYDSKTFERILNEGDEFIVTVANFSTGDISYFNSRQEIFDSRQISCEGLQGKNLKICQQQKDEKRIAFLDWIWRSANQPLFMTLSCTEGPVTDGEAHSFNGVNCWVDGGVRENIPLLRGIQYILDANPACTGSPTIDVVINNRTNIDLDPLKKKRILNSLFRTVGILSFDVRDNDVNLPAEMEKAYQLEMVRSEDDGEHRYIKVNLYYMPEQVYQLHKWDLYFEKEGMSKLWDAGRSKQVVHMPMQLSKEVAELLIKKGRSSKELY